MSNLAYLSILGVIPIGLGIWYLSQSPTGKTTIRQMATPGNVEGQMLWNEYGRQKMGNTIPKHEPLSDGEDSELSNRTSSSESNLNWKGGKRRSKKRKSNKKRKSRKH